MQIDSIRDADYRESALGALRADENTFPQALTVPKDRASAALRAVSRKDPRPYIYPAQEALREHCTSRQNPLLPNLLCGTII